MKELFYLSQEQIDRIKCYFPRSHGVPRVDDRRIVSGIIYVIKQGLQWKDAPREYGPYKTLYNRFIRWSRMGVFNRIFAELVEQNGSTTRLMIDSTHLKAHRTAASLLKKGAFPDVSDVQKAAYYNKQLSIKSTIISICNCYNFQMKNLFWISYG